MEKSTTNDISYGTDGSIQADGTSEVVYTVTHTASGKTSDTVSVTVTVTTLKVPPVVYPVSPAFLSVVKFTFNDN